MKLVRLKMIQIKIRMFSYNEKVPLESNKLCAFNVLITYIDV